MKRPVSKQNIQNAAKRNSIFFFLLLIATDGFSQFNVTEVITDYNGYWKSSAVAVNSVKPDNSHNLVSFSYGGNRYSTGVNDALLTSQGQTFIAGDYRALPVTSPGAVNSNTKIGLGSMYDGVVNGASTPAPVNNIPNYLTDGIKGLDLGTCVANLPAGTLFFPVNKILTHSIGDGNPDIVITQIADPSGSADRYEFTDINGVRVGNYVDIVLTNIPPVGNWTADFYEANKNPMVLTGGFTKTDRSIRLWASDLSAFGIDNINASRIAYFKISLSGNSDVAFVAYNNNSINIINSLLPIKLSSFSGKAINTQVLLNWETATEINSDVFTIERSADGIAFTAIDNIKAGYNTATAIHYSYTDKNPVNGKNYYRLKMADKDGNFEYSKVIIVNSQADATAAINVYPNPAKNYIITNHPFAGNNEQLQIINLQGNVLLQKKITTGSFQTRMDLPSLAKGVYEIVWTNGKVCSGSRIIIQ
ncbi:MAG: T9SS type A sorting domain-containing protein [Chitinophagaceae bacterium]